MISQLLTPIISEAKTGALYVAGLLLVLGVTVWASDSVRQRFFAVGRKLKERADEVEKRRRRDAYMLRMDRAAERREFHREWRSRRGF
jgi:hypothetical protein